MYQNKGQRKLMLTSVILFKNEFQRKMDENEILGMNSLLRNILIML